MAFDDRRLPIPRPSDDDPHRREQHDETALYDVSAGQERWKLPGAGSGAAVVGGRVCMLLDDEPTPVDLGSGEIVWQTRAGCPEPGLRVVERIFFHSASAAGGCGMVQRHRPQFFFLRLINQRMKAVPNSSVTRIPRYRDAWSLADAAAIGMSRYSSFFDSDRQEELTN